MLYIAILLVFVRIIAWDTEWRAVDRKRAEDVLSDCARFIVASLVLPLILRFFFSTLGGVLSSVKVGGTTMYVLMGFIFLLSTISSNTGSTSESDEYISLYPLEVGVGATRFGIRRTLFAMGFWWHCGFYCFFFLWRGSGRVYQRPGRRKSRLMSVWRQACLLEIGLSS